MPRGLEGCADLESHLSLNWGPRSVPHSPPRPSRCKPSTSLSQTQVEPSRVHGSSFLCGVGDPRSRPLPPLAHRGAPLHPRWPPSSAGTRHPAVTVCKQHTRHRNSPGERQKRSRPPRAPATHAGSAAFSRLTFTLIQISPAPETAPGPSFHTVRRTNKNDRRPGFVPPRHDLKPT